MKLICYGAGEMGDVFSEFLTTLGYKIEYWIDGDAHKIGTSFHGVDVKDVDCCLNEDTPVFITSVYKDEIEEELLFVGVSRERIWDFEKICRQSQLIENKLNIEQLSEWNIMVDIFTYDHIGGTEIWGERLFRKLSEMHNNVFLISKRSQMPGDSKLEKNIFCPDSTNKTLSLLTFLESHLPFVFINNFSKYGMMTAAFLKIKYGEKVQIISVVHNDLEGLFLRHAFFCDYINKVYSVSKNIMTKMEHFFPEEKLAYHIQPVDIDMDYTFRNNLNDGILRIAVASRLEVEQKRVDMIPDLLLALANRNISFHMDIAGTGSYEIMLKKEVSECGFEDNVTFFGLIPPDKMSEFWKKHDVFINISEYEGSCLSLLEAMSYGEVPVVTLVSGADEIINNEKNGYIVLQHDIESMADKIKLLDRDRKMLNDMSRLARNSIVENCDYCDFVKFFDGLILGVVSN